MAVRPAALRCLPPAWLALVLAVAVLAAYANSLRGPFVFDDPSSIVANPTIRHLTWGAFAPPEAGVTVQGRPLLNASLAFDYALGDTDVWNYHATNVAIHLLAALALFGLARRTALFVWSASGANRSPDEATWFGFAVALLWALQPLQTEAVTYVIQRAESLMGLFFLVTFYAFARSATSTRPNAWRTLVVASCWFGAATKEVAAVAPLLLWFYDRAVVSGSFGVALRRHAWMYAGLAATWVLSAWLVLGTGNRAGAFDVASEASWWGYWATQLPAIAHYFRLAAWPAPLVFEYGTFWVRHFDEILLPGAIVASIIVATLVALRRAPTLGFLGVWFFAILAPTSLLPGTTQMIVEHRLYLSLAAIVAAASWAAGRLLGARAIVPLLVLATAFGALTARRNRDYRTEVGLWADTVAKRPHNPLAQQMLAMALDQAGDLSGAARHYEAALALKPNFAFAHDLYGQLLSRTGHRTEAAEHFANAVRLQPQFADAHDHLAVALAQQRRYADALAEHAIAVRLKPDFAEAHFNFANTLGAAGRTDDAIAEYTAALRLKPDYPAAEYNLANTLEASGRPGDAVDHYRAALQLRPQYAAAYNNLGGAFLDLGRIDDAIAAYEAALQIDPNLADARDNLARIRAAAGAQNRNNARQR